MTLSFKKKCKDLYCIIKKMALDDDIFESKIWKIRLATFKYLDVFEHYYKIRESIVEMKEEIDNYVLIVEEEEEKEIGNIEDINVKEEVRKKEKEVLKILLDEYTTVLNSIRTFKHHLNSLPNTFKDLANIVDPNNDIDF